MPMIKVCLLVCLLVLDKSNSRYLPSSFDLSLLPSANNCDFNLPDEVILSLITKGSMWSQLEIHSISDTTERLMSQQTPLSNTLSSTFVRLLP